jgi:hypothetical protein
MSPEELDVLVRKFGNSTATSAEWTHAAHLAVAAVYVRRYGAEAAFERFRDGILNLNEAHGTPNTDTRGYHETITRAYMTLIGEFVAGRAAEDEFACADALLESPLAGRDALLRYYSKAVLTSVDARRRWVAPDLQPLRLERADDVGP